MNSEQISAPLRRSINTTTQYDHLLPNVSCQVFDYGNEQNSIAEGVDFIADMIYQYAWQTKKLVNHLVKTGVFNKKNTAGLVRQVFGFCHSHIQYKADEALQELRSPACAWKQRFTGVDCKSYTIFVISLLHNLGFKNAVIRWVKQPGPYSHLWTHVYAILPVKQSVNTLAALKLDKPNNYFVIDPTTHTNREVLFTEKKDKLMQVHKYVGLNAPGNTQTGVKLTQKEHEYILKLKQSLSKGGFSSAQIAEILTYIKQIISVKGKNSIVFRMAENAILIKPSKNDKGRLFVLNQGLNAAQSGNDLGKEISGIFKDIDFGEVFEGIGDGLGDFISNLYNSIADGCIGSTFTGNDIKKFIKADFNPKTGILAAAGLIKTANHTPTIKNLNRFKEIMTMYRWIAQDFSTKLRSCSRKNLQELKAKAQEFEQEVIDQLARAIKAKGGKLEIDYAAMPQASQHGTYRLPQAGVTMPVVPGGFGGYNKNKGPHRWAKYRPNVYKITGKEFVELPSIDLPDTKAPGGITNPKKNTGVDSSLVTDTRYAKTSSVPRTAGVAVAAGAAILLWPQIKTLLNSKKKKDAK